MGGAPRGAPADVDPHDAGADVLSALQPGVAQRAGRIAVDAVEEPERQAARLCAGGRERRQGDREDQRAPDQDCGRRRRRPRTSVPARRTISSTGKAAPMPLPPPEPVRTASATEPSGERPSGASPGGGAEGVADPPCSAARTACFGAVAVTIFSRRLPSGPAARSARPAAPASRRGLAVTTLPVGVFPSADGTDSRYSSIAELPGGALVFALWPSAGAGPASARTARVASRRLIDWLYARGPGGLTWPIYRPGPGVRSRTSSSPHQARRPVMHSSRRVLVVVLAIAAVLIATAGMAGAADNRATPKS